MKLVYYDSSAVDAAVVLVEDEQNMLDLDDDARNYLGDSATRTGAVELDPDDAAKLELLGMSVNRFYVG